MVAAGAAGAAGAADAADAADADEISRSRRPLLLLLLLLARVLRRRRLDNAGVTCELVLFSSLLLLLLLWADVAPYLRVLECETPFETPFGGCRALRFEPVFAHSLFSVADATAAAAAAAAAADTDAAPLCPLGGFGLDSPLGVDRLRALTVAAVDVWPPESDFEVFFDKREVVAACARPALRLLAWLPRVVTPLVCEVSEAASLASRFLALRLVRVSIRGWLAK